MMSRFRSGALLLVLALTLSAACRRETETAGTPDTPPAESGGAAPAESAAPAAETGAVASVPVEVAAADLDAFECGFAKEIEVVKAAQQRAASATTAVERANAAQAQWEDQTAPEGARAAGLAPERYRAVRETVTRVLETLDFQGKIEGPKSIDLERAAPEMRARVAGDAYSGLSPATASAIRARMDRLVPLWVEYVNLTAVAG